MANQKNFAITPSVSISRSKFRRPSQHKTSFNLGQLVPIYVDADILPGDTVSLDLSALIRMSTPIAPIMDNIYVDYYAFFVPNRLVWDDWKQFMGENTSSFGAASEPIMPTCKITGSGNALTTNSLGAYMGLPIYTGDQAEQVSCIPGRAYLTVYNEWFRDQNIIAPYAVRKTSGNYNLLGVDPVNSGNLTYAMSLVNVAKESDYFTRALPYAQKGSPVTLPLGATAPVIIQAAGTGASAISSTFNPFNTEAINSTNRISKLAASDGTVSGNMLVDLANATSATINQLRFAFQYQKFLEKDAQSFYRASINRAISVNA